jgi:hypothetical protein
MRKNGIRNAMIASAATLSVIGAALWVIKHEHTAHLERVQGAWEGAIHMRWGRLTCVQRIVLRISSTNGAYRAEIDQVDLGRENLPVTRLGVGWTAVNFKLASGISYRGDLDPSTMEIRGRWMWPGGKYSQPLAFTRTNMPDAVPEPLAERDYAPRQGSDLQGLWQGTWNADKPLRLNLKIAEVANGKFRAELESVDEPPVIPIPVTSLNYEQPRVKISLQGIAAAYDGKLNENHSKIIGTWTRGRPSPLTFERVNPADEKPALETAKQ